MANICTTEYVFEGEGRKINALHEKLKELVKSTKKEGNPDSWKSEPNWLGYIVEKILEQDYQSVPCRGEFFVGGVENSPYNDDNLILHVSTSTAWSPCQALFEKLAERFDCLLYWVAEEFGCDLYQSNDTEGKYFRNEYVVDIVGIGEEYFETEEKAVSYVAGLTGNPNITWDELEDLDDVFVHQLEYV